MKPASRWTLLWPVLASILIPLVAAWFMYPDTHLPPKFGVFPPAFVEQAPGFKLSVFVVIAACAVVILLFLFFPRLFGFRPAAAADTAPKGKARFPFWFWLGGLCTAFFWWLMWARETPFGDLVYYAFTPLWWGFIFFLDGIVFRLNGGRSLAATRPLSLLISAGVSLVGWYYFEYYNYFVLGNWYYPYGEMPELSHTTIVAIYLLAYTTVWPVIFEWYTLLASFPRLFARWSQGPKLALPGWPLILVGLVLIALMVFWPRPLFWAVWIGPLAVVTGILIQHGIWNPFSAIAEGNWSPGVLMGLASLFNGLVWELWNYGSAHPELPITNPNFWIYDVPYVNVIHLHSEMPLLGYFGYIPFGVLTWVVYIWCGKVAGFDPSLTLDAAPRAQLKTASAAT